MQHSSTTSPPRPTLPPHAQQQPAESLVAAREIALTDPALGALWLQLFDDADP